ncbi:DUF3108 domain-containing protein [Planctobacterium marinum]|uniref:DUF3108 domain-containing protein n=1 Tax=Planctobacterium marinum TaxID=1631968 RepID=A0AA48HQ80_9ALTE|nr:hypothetical protein MACH26_22080 [Planctobacterium marinum]
MKLRFNYLAKIVASLLLISGPAVIAQESSTAVADSDRKVVKAAEQLKPFFAKYTAYRNGSDIGHAVMSLEKAENGYKLFYQSDVSIFFLSDTRSETSYFNIVDGQFVPHTYAYLREGTGRDKSLDLTFNDDKTITIKNRKKQASTINWQGEWDNQLYRFDLQRQLKQGVTETRYNLINYRGELKTYGFEVAGEEVLKLPFGKLNTIKVKTIRNNNRRVTWSWFAPDLNYQLVRLQQFKEGDEQGDIQLSEYRVSE